MFSIQGLIIFFMLGILVTLIADLILDTIREYKRLKLQEKLRRML